jgi:hypothetical protein
MKFSQRIGKEPVKTEFQIESMDNDLRTALWNAFQMFFFEKIDSDWILSSNFGTFFNTLWINFFKFQLDDIVNNFQDMHVAIKTSFFLFEWYEVYDFIEFVAQADSPANKDGFIKYCNKMMERELSGYRFVGNTIAKITDENELSAIEEAIENSSVTKLSGVNLHLKSALAKLSDRKSPDYRNSIKESISAVEAISIIISGNSKASLEQALKIIEQSVGLHGALKRGFIAIYGYTSDSGGIRHALLGESNIEFEDAKYMLVSCSAFINYLIMKAEKSGIKF